MLSFTFVLFLKIMSGRRYEKERQMEEYIRQQREMEFINRVKRDPEMFMAI